MTANEAISTAKESAIRMCADDSAMLSVNFEIMTEDHGLIKMTIDGAGNLL